MTTTPLTYSESLHLARAEHRTSIDHADRWSCSCGAGAQPRMIPPTRSMAKAGAERHIEAAAKRLRIVRG